ncbi:MAG: peptidylprolyl isomerase [Akkermansia sp.]|nr:peptidylprolyl isomerase [Akkermansia sp.]
MRISSLKLTAIKLALFTTVLGYLAIDLWVVEGPVYRILHPLQTAAAEEPVASVNGERITRAQLARHTAEQNLLAGRESTDNSRPATMVLGLVNNSMVRIQARYNDRNLPPQKQEAQEEMARLQSRAADEHAFNAALLSQGYTRENFAAKLEARLLELAVLERAADKHTAVGNEALKLHYDQLKDELEIPASRTVKHIFLATLEKDPETVKATAEALLARIQAGESFADVARECSEDERSAPKGGDLGTLYDDGTLPLEELNLFGESPLAAGTPALVQSRWGWHIVLAGPVTPAYTPSLDECRESLRSAIESAQRELATDAYFDTALKEGRAKKHIIIYGGK